MEVTIKIPPPHSDGQREIILSQNNDVIFGGRRWGKTEAGVERLFICAFTNPGLYWWVGLTWRSASMKRAWRRIKQITRTLYVAAGIDPTPFIREVDKEVILPNGAEIWMRSAERPESLAGEGLRGAILDEFTLMKERVWTEYVEAALLDFDGWAMFMGVPKGNNWAAVLWRDAPNRPGWKQWHFTTYDNPYIDNDKIDEIKSHTAERWFNQEYMAQVIDDAGGVFRNVVAAATADEQTVPVADYYQPGGGLVKTAPYEPEGNGHFEQVPHEYIFGVDWGQQNDFTVITVIDLNMRQVVYIDRFNKIDYIVQSDRLKALNNRFNPTVIIAEENSMGKPIVERLIADGLPVRPFTTTNVTKEAIIRDLAAAFENGEIKIIKDADLINELQAFEQKPTQTGRWKFGAPEGLHDDTVMSLAIGWFGVTKTSSIVLFEV